VPRFGSIIGGVLTTTAAGECPGVLAWPRSRLRRCSQAVHRNVPISTPSKHRSQRAGSRAPRNREYRAPGACHQEPGPARGAVGV